MIPYLRMASGLRSMSSLATVSVSLFSPAISSRTGATILHGPHHSAQKSTSTVLSLCSTSVLKVASVTSTVFLDMRDLLFERKGDGISVDGGRDLVGGD